MTTRGATRGEGKPGPGTAEVNGKQMMDAREKIQSLGGASGRCLKTFFPFSRQIAGILNNKKEDVGFECGFPKTERPPSRLATLT